MSDIIYILQCTKNKYFIGCCPKKKLIQTLRKHRDGKSSVPWTRRYNGVKCLKAIERSYEDQETIETEKAMKIWGIKNVRGGKYNKLLITPFQKRKILRKFKWDAKACWRCGRKSHFVGACRQTTYTDGSSISDNEEESDDEEECKTVIRYTYSTKEYDNRPTPGMTWHYIPPG